MAFLISEIRNQKWLELDVDVAKYIKDNSISIESMIYELQFDKKVFKEEKEVREYLVSKYLSQDVIEDNGTHFIAKTLHTNQMNLETVVSLELRRGVHVLAADLRPLVADDSYHFSAKEGFSLATDIIHLNLNDGAPTIIEIARVVEGDHPSYGKINITKEHLKSFVNNFNSKVTGTDLAVNEDHKKNEAFGWFKDVFLSQDETRCYGMVDWNVKGARALSEKEYRYFSPEFRFNYVHPHTLAEHGATLLGGALTNYPFLKMDAITELSEKQQTKDKAMPTIELAEHDKIVLNLNGKVTEANANLDAAKAQVVELSAKVATLTAEASKVARESANKKLFDAQKINAAQLVALNEGKSMYEVMELAGPAMNVKENGNTNKGTEVTELSEKDKVIAKRMGLTDEEFIAGNKVN